jgi:hypothetical protein
MTNSRRGFVAQVRAVWNALEIRIKAEIAAAEEPTPVSVGYPPGGLQAEHIWIGGQFDAEMQRYVSGGLQRDEIGEVEVRILVKWSAAEMLTACDRALALSEIVEDAVSTDPTLGGVVEEAHVAGVRGNEGMPDEHSREYGLVMRVAYRTTAVLT